MSSDAVITVVTSVYIVPNVRNAVLLEVGVVILGVVVNDSVIASACDHEEVRLLAAFPVERACNAGSGADSANIADLVSHLHTDEERLTSAH